MQRFTGLFLLAVGILFAFFGVLGSVGAVAAVNGLADGSPPHEHTMTVSGKRISTGRRGAKTYHVAVPAWNRPGEALEFQVSPAEYDHIAPGRSKLELTTGRGWLGIEWLKARRVQP